MEHFTPFSALLGGLLIGTSALLLLGLNGRIAGISNIAGQWLTLPRRAGGERLWRLLFLLGVVGGALLYAAFAPVTPAARPHFPAWLLALAGLLVGFGSSLGGGCTSGHGVCGLARLSLRSLVATVTFLLSGIITTYVVRHLWGIV
jgi:hypothetical protein